MADPAQNPLTLIDSQGLGQTHQTVEAYEYDGSNPPNYRGSKIGDYTEPDSVNYPGQYYLSSQYTRRIVLVVNGNNLPGWVGKWVFGEVLIGEPW